MPYLAKTVLARAVLCAALAAALGCCGCAPAAYWVPGLTLPPGSTVVSKAETSNVQGQFAMLPFKGAVDKVLNVSFDCTGGWSAVSAHVDTCLNGQGYTDQLGALSGMAGMPNLPAASGMFSSMRMYSKNGTKYTVMLMDMQGTMQAASNLTGRANPMPGGAPGMGAYMMSVIKTK
jgi:hypothetical protein